MLKIFMPKTRHKSLIGVNNKMIDEEKHKELLKSAYHILYRLYVSLSIFIRHI